MELKIKNEFTRFPNLYSKKIFIFNKHFHESVDNLQKNFNNPTSDFESVCLELF